MKDKLLARTALIILTILFSAISVVVFIRFFGFATDDFHQGRQVLGTVDIIFSLMAAFALFLSLYRGWRLYKWTMK